MVELEKWRIYMSKSKRQIARQKAIIGIYQYILVDNSLEDIYEFLGSDETLRDNKETMEFAKWLVDTTIQNYDSYKILIEKYLKQGWNFERLSAMERAILLIATCEILDSKLDERIIINEAIINAKEFCDEDSYKFINGVLHKVI
jgi:N utilization substance protein B